MAFTLKWPERVGKLVLMGGGTGGMSLFTPMPTEGIKRLNQLYRQPTIENLKLMIVDSIGQRNSYVKTWGCGGFLNETNIYSRGKSLCF